MPAALKRFNGQPQYIAGHLDERYWRPGCVKETAVTLLHEDRLFPAETETRKIGVPLNETIKALPIVSPHGHTQASWFAHNQRFPDPVKLLVQPDHYIFRMLYSQGISLEDLEIGKTQIVEPRKVWRIFASN